MLNKSQQMEKVLIDCGALLSGHFLLTSGKHSDKYMQCAKILQHPNYAEIFAKELAKQLTGVKADVVAGPAMGGIIIGYELARQLSCMSVFAERENNKLVLRRGFGQVVEGKNVIVAEDVITTGGSVLEVMEAVRNNGGTVTAVAVLVDRTKGVDFGVKLAKAYRADFNAYQPEECPICKEGKIGIEKPGSRSTVC